MEGQAQAPRFEPRWPVALTILAVFVLLEGMPARVRVFPSWFTYIIAAVVLAPLAAVTLASDKARWHRVEHTVLLLFCVFFGIGTVSNLATLIGAILHASGRISGLQLLASSISVWVANVFVFSLLYWLIDRGGPGPRACEAAPRPDFLFPQAGASPEDVPPGWRPMFLDYLYLGFTTATAFSTTDVMPLSSRAKLAMMLESSISLATIVVVASRAINILGN